VVRGEPDVKRVVANAGKGNPRVYYNLGQQNERASFGELLVELKTRDEAEIERALSRIRAGLADDPSATYQVLEFEQGPPLDAPIALRVLGEDPALLAVASREVEAALRATPGTRDVKNPTRDRKTDLRVRVDRDRAALAGVAVPEVDRAVRLAVGGAVAGHYREDGAEDARDVRVTLARSVGGALPGAPRPSPQVLERLYLPGAEGAVPLEAVATLELEPSPARIFRTDRTRSATVTAQVLEGANTDRVTRAVLARLAGERWPAGIRVQPAGELESREESFGGLGSAIIVAAIGVLAVLVLEFRTFRSTLIVASVIPLGVVGGLVALFLSGNTLSFTATIGFVALLGIEVKNSILLVDFTNQLREEGVQLEEAVRRAGETRFVPILLTTLTAMGGLVPLALERSALYSPLALVILGGLVSSTLLARLVTPVLYVLLPPELDGETERAPEAADPARGSAATPAAPVPA
jgi:multidrug efflux pump subunit AcrB